MEINQEKFGFLLHGVGTEVTNQILEFPPFEMVELDIGMKYAGYYLICNKDPKLY